MLVLKGTGFGPKDDAALTSVLKTYAGQVKVATIESLLNELSLERRCVSGKPSGSIRKSNAQNRIFLPWGGREAWAFGVKASLMAPECAVGSRRLGRYQPEVTRVVLFHRAKGPSRGIPLLAPCCVPFLSERRGVVWCGMTVQGRRARPSCRPRPTTATSPPGHSPDSSMRSVTPDPRRHHYHHPHHHRTASWIMLAAADDCGGSSRGARPLSVLWGGEREGGPGD
jgi:hypothetical protein